MLFQRTMSYRSIHNLTYFCLLTAPLTVYFIISLQDTEPLYTTAAIILLIFQLSAPLLHYVFVFQKPLLDPEVVLLLFLCAIPLLGSVMLEHSQTRGGFPVAVLVLFLLLSCLLFPVRIHYYWLVCLCCGLSSAYMNIGPRECP